MLTMASRLAVCTTTYGNGAPLSLIKWSNRLRGVSPRVGNAHCSQITSCRDSCSRRASGLSAAQKARKAVIIEAFGDRNDAIRRGDYEDQLYCPVNIDLHIGYILWLLKSARLYNRPDLEEC